MHYFVAIFAVLSLSTQTHAEETQASKVTACCECSTRGLATERYLIEESTIKEARAACTSGSAEPLKCTLTPDMANCR